MVYRIYIFYTDQIRHRILTYDGSNAAKSRTGVPSAIKSRKNKTYLYF